MTPRVLPLRSDATADAVRVDIQRCFGALESPGKEPLYSTVRYVIDRSGRVSGFSLLDRSYTGQGVFDRCVERVFRGLRYEPPRRPLPVLLPYVFAATLASAHATRTSVAMKRNHARFQRCFRSELLRRPVMEGHVILVFELDRFGNVRRPRIEARTMLVRPSLKACLLEQLQSIPFHAIADEGTYKVRYKLELRR